MKKILVLLFALFCNASSAQSNLPACLGVDSTKWNNCFGISTYRSKDKYVGEFKQGSRNGQGIYLHEDGEITVGDWEKGQPNGKVIILFSNKVIDLQRTGTYLNGELVTSHTIELNSFKRLDINILSELNNSIIKPTPKLNALERALDFETGNSSQYNEWADDGALHRLNDWYNISIIMVDSPQYERNGGPLSFVGLVPLPGTSINQMKAALGKACGIAPEAWNREQLRERTTLKAKGLKCQARFDNWFRGEGVWNMIIQKNE